MKTNWQHFGVLGLAMAAVGMPAQFAVAQSTAESEDELVEEIVTIGSRNANRPRSAADSTVPIDVISGDEFNALGGTADITDNLRAMVPSYTATPATGDGSAFIRSTSLRGTAPDQTLVLVNGKRRHRSALIQFLAPAAGNGAHGSDIGMIPGIAVKRVEVLRDGASSQYGSDAIAGVINFVMKDDAEGGEVQVQYGQHYEGEESVKVSANAGFAAGDSGFVNVSAEYIDNDGLSRGHQRPAAQSLIDGGTPGVGQDAVFGDAPFVQSWGRPETSGLRVFVNSGFDISDTSELYARFGYGDTEGRYRFFWRSPTHSFFTTPVLDCFVCAPGEALSLIDQGWDAATSNIPAGFTPFLDGDQTDSSLVLGVQGEYESGMLYDFSFGYGKNSLDYFLNNSGNNQLGPGDFMDLPQMDFDVGGYEQKEIQVNADFSLRMSDSVNLAFGGEWREETYAGIAGEPNSYFGAGTSGLKGVSADDAADPEVRENIAAYVDIEHDVSDALLVQYALRFENFSDFGDTINWKLAARYRTSDAFAIRGAASTGFHAPTPGQSSARTTITTADSVSGLLVDELLLPFTDPIAASVGAIQLTEETSLNLSLGFTADFGDNTSLTFDVYKIDVDDRIYKTGNIPNPTLPPGNPGTVAIFTNALDVEHTGFDLVLTTGFDWGTSANTDLTFAASYNEIDVVSSRDIQVPDGMGGFTTKAPVSSTQVQYIETNFPNERATLSANTFFGDDMNLMLRLNFYGSHLDERGVQGGQDDGTTGFCCVNKTASVDSTIYFDLDFGYQINDNWRVNVGAINVFDEFINTVLPDPPAGSPAGTGSEFNNRWSVGLPYPRRTAANYEGGQWYLRASYNFE